MQKLKENVTISISNSKLGLSIPSINLPPITTCRKNAPCSKGCYATRGNFCFSNVKNSHLRNLDIYKNDPTFYFDSIRLASALSKYFRWHSAGDIVDEQYFVGMVKVARQNKDTNFLCFTKKYEIINEYLNSGKRIPKNLTTVFSNWDNFVCENPFNLPTTWVWAKEFNNEIIPKTSIPCAGKCYQCQACWQLKKGQSVFFKKH